MAIVLRGLFTSVNEKLCIIYKFLFISFYLLLYQGDNF